MNGARIRPFSAILLSPGSVAASDPFCVLASSFSGPWFATTKSDGNRVGGDQGEHLRDELSLLARGFACRRNQGRPAPQRVERAPEAQAHQRRAVFMGHPLYQAAHQIVGDPVHNHAMMRRYAPAFLAALEFSAAPAAQDILNAVSALRVMYAGSSRRRRSCSSGVHGLALALLIIVADVAINCFARFYLGYFRTRAGTEAILLQSHFLLAVVVAVFHVRSKGARFPST